MKGPGFRLDLDVRRVWKCPQCGRISRTPGRVTAERCPNDATWMRLVEAEKKNGAAPAQPRPESEDSTANDNAE